MSKKYKKGKRRKKEDRHSEPPWRPKTKEAWVNYVKNNMKDGERQKHLDEGGNVK